MDIRIKQYLSWSQFSMFLRSKEEYRRVYINGGKTFSNKETEFGSRVSDGLENSDEENLTGDAVVDFCKLSLPKVDEREKEMTVKFGDITLLVRMDGFEKPSLIYEYKTGHLTPDGKKPWTQAKVDSWGQLTFYAFAFYLSTGIIPDLKLVWIPTKKIETGEFNDRGKSIYRIELTGESPIVFNTKRTLVDFAKMSIKIKKVWEEIGEMVKEEALKD